MFFVFGYVRYMVDIFGGFFLVYFFLLRVVFLFMRVDFCIFIIVFLVIVDWIINLVYLLGFDYY